MGAIGLLEQLSVAGLTLRADGRRLIVKPSSALTDELRQLIRSNKDALLSALSLGACSIPRAWWRLHYPDRGWREVCFAPTVSRAEALLLHRDATDAVPGWD